ncbi:big defensin-like isoform X2 [Dreissena polymorpha]|nr:big defensin-like isoform X2 [Dreissena polymorpha]
MNTQGFYCVFYILLLTMTVPSLCAHEALEDAPDREKRDMGFAVAPIAVYAGAAVSPWVWAALVAAYGLAALHKYHVSRTSSDNHSCANNRGWCRKKCWDHERIDRYHSDVCGKYYCCR